MVIQCMECKRIRVDGLFRLPLPDEIGPHRVANIYCPRCATEMLSRIQAGEFALPDYVERLTANS
ncbi:MAG: hypothetical protein LBU79_08010 [Planctomycetota bacterium]|jgi:hypothetical protein|nr:hypothetical protein [Planctomycetota bacterium]